MDNKAWMILRDIAKAFLLGISLALIFALILFGIGMLVGNNSISSGLEAAKDGLLLLTAGGMFLIAGMILVKGKKQEQPTGDGWKRHFQIVGYKGILGTISISFLFLAEITDMILIKNIL